MRNILIIIASVALAADLSLLFSGALGDADELFTAEEFFADTNVETIEIDKDISQDSFDFTLTELDIGDEYSVLRFESQGSGMLTGVRLFQDSQELYCISSANSSYQKSAIAFEPANGTEGIEIQIVEMESYKEMIYVYPIEFEDDTARLDIAIDDSHGTIEVVLGDEAITVTRSGPTELYTAKIHGYPRVPSTVVLLRDGTDINNIHSQSPKDIIPDELKLITYEIILSDDVIVVPVS